MPTAPSSPYQPLLLRIIHGFISICVIAALVTAFWTYSIYDGRWGTLPLPHFNEIEGIHGTFGLVTSLGFPVLILYAFHRGQRRLLQPQSLQHLQHPLSPIGGYTLHRLAMTLNLLALALAIVSGKMMNEAWLPAGELNHRWYWVHLMSWVVMVVCVGFHVLMSAKVGGGPLLHSIMSYHYRAQDHPKRWRSQVQQWWHGKPLAAAWKSRSWPQSFVGRLELLIWVSLAIAWVLPLIAS